MKPQLGAAFLAFSLLAGAAHAQGQASAQVSAAKPLSGERERLGYMIGMDVGGDPAIQSAAPDIDMAAFEQSVRRALAGQESTLRPEDAQATSLALMQRVQARRAGTLDKAPAISRQHAGELMGVTVGRSLATIRADFDMAAFMRGLRVTLDKGKPLLSAEEADAIRQAFAARQQQRAADTGEENRRAGEAFMAENRRTRGVITTRSGLQYQVIRPGTGARPAPSARVRVDYEGRLLDGKVFDSSYQRGEPAQFALNQVIPGWTEGVGLMSVGAKYRFWVPGDLAYGRRGSPPTIGPNQTLVFDVELHEILK